MKKKWIILACILFVLFLLNLTSKNQNLASGNEMTDSTSILDHNGHGSSSDIPLETVISRRISIKRSQFYSDTELPWEVVSKVLWAAYGYSSWSTRTVPSLCGSYPLMIYVCNATACYNFVPETQSLNLWKHGDYRAVGGGYMAPILLYIAVNTDRCGDIYWGNAESGCMIQSIYLMANALNLGTVCMGGSWLDRTYIHEQLGLPQNEEVLYKMPLGYLNPPYEDYQNLVAASRPSSQELPEIQDSNLSIADALDAVFSSHQWSENPVTKQELSQLLWASYGYSYYEDTAASSHPMNISRHRTVPSARAKYPMIIYAVNSSGIFRYVPYEHTITMVVVGDRRQNIAAASGHDWMASAPLMIGLVWNDSRIYNINTTYTEVGLITQNIYLESAAWGLIADWGKADTDEEAMREALGLVGQTHLHLASIITVGPPDITPPIISILSPEDKTYAINDVPLTFTVSESTSWIGYSLDNQANVTMTGNITLTDLAEGSHNIIVYANDTAGNMGSSDMVYFAIQTSPIDTTPPSISIVSPENKTCDTTDIPLTFTVDESVLWMAYSFDNKANATITGNTTLSGLSDGSHSLIVYAKDTAGNTGASEVIYFTIETKKAEPFPMWIVAAIVIIAVAGAALPVYFAKIKKTTEKEA